MVFRRKFQDTDCDKNKVSWPGGGAMLPGWGNAHTGTWVEVGCKYRDLDGSQVGPE